MPEDLLMDKALKMLHLNKRSQVAFRSKARWISLFAVAGSLTFFPSPRAFAQDPANADQQQQQAQPLDDQKAPAQQDQRRVISRDNIPQNTQTGPDQDRDQNPMMKPARSSGIAGLIRDAKRLEICLERSRFPLAKLFSFASTSHYRATIATLARASPPH